MSILEIEVLLNRLEQGRIDLQPDFQRAYIWTNLKKQRLIDSILRKWHVPPLHFVREESGSQSVLDGQQRLTAIWDFARDRFPVNGRIDPISGNLALLHGYKFSALPSEVRQAFLQFQIQAVNVTDHSPEEAFELFFRLNEPVSLTSAEKRNAFFGDARDQVRSLVERAISCGWNKQTIGFSNLRMAYDDIIARLCLALERQSVREPLPGTAITKRYRSDEGFSDPVMQSVSDAIQALSRLEPVQRGQIRFNRATLFSWLIFLARDRTGHNAQLGDFLAWFEDYRENLRSERRGRPGDLLLDDRDSREVPILFGVYDDRATARVLDVSSILARDLVIWTMYYLHSRESISGPVPVRLPHFVQRIRAAKNVERELFEFIDNASWGTW